MTLRTIEQDPVMGAYFRIPVRELIGTHQSNVRYELDFITLTTTGSKIESLQPLSLFLNNPI